MNIPLIGGRKNITAIYNELQDLKRQQEVLSETYLERHPRMVENIAAIKAVERALWTAIQQASKEHEIEQSMIKDELASLENKLQEAEEEARRLESLSIEYRVLSRKVEAQREIFDQITSRFNETSITQQMNLTTIRTLDHAALPKQAIWPDIKKIGLASCMLFGCLFVSVPLALEFIDNRLKTFNDIERFVGKPVIGDIKLHKGRTDNEIATLALNDDFHFSEPFDTIYGALRLQMGNFAPPLSFVITSSVPSEGKTIVATNLAGTLAKHQFKAIIIDCDLRRPSVHRYLDIENDRGLLHWLRGDTQLADDPLADEALGISQIKAGINAYILPAGGSTKQAGPVFEEPRFDQLISKLKQHFDFVIFDTSPVGLFHDATIVADYADHTIFVARQNATNRQKVRHSIAQMDRTEAPVLGVVFNGVKNHNLATGYGYNSSGYSYSDRYSYGDHKAAKKYHAAYLEAE
ncbi:polysaccharide biosynthesis tyrosine autokinase [Coraliomargarita algicola]|uniref:Polysaccharide biosynthesis tyrosine autokinase n=1 Tax=Coraliomargarita algicola TaxID=3092156 RepID=A0ABZ0RPL4_9BACT|nr:polysaccharide biosynthesis tyrosine autokinase [Coraliomargarita sp. J2-16]WPJ97366.1 polysaccharide biosynthesis tyrosine autokinase [Coraliomargarita sp. J2-16]